MRPTNQRLGATSKANRMLWVQATTETLLEDFDDDKALALVALVELVAYEKEFGDRDSIAHTVRSEAFTYTIAFSDACQAFANKAKRAAMNGRIGGDENGSL